MEAESKKHYLYRLKELGDQRGGLVAVTSEVEIPFPIRRVFYNYRTLNEVIRGNHANKISNFVLISIVGSCVVDVDEIHKTTQYVLDSPDKALFIGNGLWKIMKDFSEDNVLLVFSDYEYDEKEYIRNYEDYLNLMKTK